MKVDVIEVIDQDDGGAIVKFDMDDECVNSLIRAGIQDLINEHGHKFVVVRHDEWDEFKKVSDIPEPRQYDMSDYEAQAFFQIGTLNAIKRGIEEVAKLKNEDGQMEFDFDWEESKVVMEEEANNGC